MTDSSNSNSATPIRVAVIVAHPDDAEFGCAGTVARWAAEGRHVTYVLLTSGDKGSSDPDVTPEQLVTTREAEQRAACEILGVKDVVFLRRSDATLVPDLELRRELTRVIRQVKPDIVICQDPTVQFVGTSYLNHPDHRAAGQATLDAIYPSARDRMTFPELLAEGLEPHKVREVYVDGTDSANIWVDISGHWQTKVAALKAHVSQVGDWDPEPMVKEWAERTAREHPGNGDLAEGFRYFRLD
ncbi:MAG TPA: PIG-L deacetylase family protein [Thermomicrobiales bacterium]|jgi:LmbE family N-acetylglucosaminyl deacetylase|nr:PIG-L deacetylase family protein [Thermomicrobiales bacterium]